MAMRRPLARLLFPFLIASALAGCGQQDQDTVEVTVIGKTAPALADPAVTTLPPPSQVLIASIAQGLVRFDARGQIEPGLAERWNVSDDGLSYIFRIAAADLPDGRSVNAREVARILNRQLRSASKNPLKDALGAVSEIVAMTDRVIEIRLRAPRPNLLQLLAQPEMAIIRDGEGTGPYARDKVQPAAGAIALSRTVRIVDDADRVEHIQLRSADAAKAIDQFRKGEAELVLGGTFSDLPLVARRERSTRSALRFDPVAGLFGLVPTRAGGALADQELRDLLNRTINRDALIAALDVPGLVARTTVLQDGLEGGARPVAPSWSGLPFGNRYRDAVNARRPVLVDGEKLKLAIALPEGPGANILFARLAADWGPLGIDLVRAGKGVQADLKLVDAVAPSSSPAWFVRSFRCGVVALCSAKADELMDSARAVPSAGQRAAMLAEAGRLIDESVLFLPIAAPIRWSLVGDGLPGFSENIFARHPLSGLRDKPTRERQ